MVEGSLKPYNENFCAKMKQFHLPSHHDQQQSKNQNPKIMQISCIIVRIHQSLINIITYDLYLYLRMRYFKLIIALKLPCPWHFQLMMLTASDSETQS
jgi:hypothetical protein